MKTLLVTCSLLWPFVSFGQDQLSFGRFNSKAIFNRSSAPKCHAPLVVLVPGSSAHGPEDMMPAFATEDGKDHDVFGAFSDALIKGGVGSLAIGKPGVDFFKSWDQRYYDEKLFQNLGWQDLGDNLRDAVISKPRGPRKQKFLDQTLGPVDAAFPDLLEETATRAFEMRLIA